MQRFSSLLRVPFVRHLATLQVASIVSTAASFLQSVIFARLLGLDGFGVYAIVLAFSGLCSIAAGFGQQHTTTVFLAEAWGRKDREAMRVILRYYLQMTLLGLLLMTGAWLVSPILTQHLYSNTDYGILARWALLSTMLELVPAYIFIAMQVCNQFPLLVILQSVRTILQLLFSTLFLLLGWGVAGALWGSVLTAVLYLPPMILLYERRCAAWGFPSMLGELKHLRTTGTFTYVRQGLWIALDKHLGGNLYPNAFLVILSLTTSVGTVGLFRLAFRLARLPGTFISPNINLLASTTIPKVVHKGKKALSDACIKLTKGTLGLQILATLGGLILVPPLIPIVYGPAFRAATAPFIVMLFMHMLAAPQVAVVPLLRVFNRVRYAVYVQVLSIAAGVVSYFLLLKAFDPLMAMSLAITLYFFVQLSLLIPLWHILRAT